MTRIISEAYELPYADGTILRAADVFTTVVNMGNIRVSATEANRSFARVLRLVRNGQRVQITSHGETVAVIAPPDEADAADRQRREQALDQLQHHWATLKSVTIGPWTREELYQRD